MTTDARIEPLPDVEGKRAIALHGEFDLANIESLRQALGKGNENLVVDVTAVTYLDSAGVAALFQRAQLGGLEITMGPGCLIATLLEISRLDDVAPVHHLNE